MTRDRSGDEGVTIVVPAYDEEAGIGQVLADLESVLSGTARPWEILVVNDGSNDDTARVAAAAGDGVRVVSHDVNMGYGASIKTGIRRARYDLIAITDADSTYPAEAIPGLLDAMDSVDMAVAARVGDSVQIPWVRRPAKWLLNRLAAYLSGRKIPDLNSGMRCFRKSTVESEYLHLLPNGFSLTTTITLAYHAESRLVRYLPIDYKKRIGSSKIRPLRDTYNFFLLILRTVMYFDPMRIFVPPALLSFFVTLGTLAYDVGWERNVADKSLIWLMITVLLFGMALLGDLIVKRRR
ncbi:MAG: glycosyltransferase family 2 protein [Thermoanaerobaculia bacterium]|nr:glycosyltransferase family 2 protein [Thermoanaerobaculia bacterium]